MEPQRIKDIKAALSDMSMEELQEMSDNLNDLIFKLTTYMDQNEVLDSMRTALRDEFARYMDEYGTK